MMIHLDEATFEALSPLFATMDANVIGVGYQCCGESVRQQACEIFELAKPVAGRTR